MIKDVIPVEHLHIPELLPYRSLRQERRSLSSSFVAESHKVVELVLRGDNEIFSLLLTPEWLSKLSHLIDARPEMITVYVSPQKALEGITGYSLHDCIMAHVRTPSPLEIPDVLESAVRPLLSVAIDGLTSTDNVGMVARSCAAFGVSALIVGETSADPYLRRAVRKSMGTVTKVPLIYTNSLINSLNDLRRAGVQVLAAHPRAESISLFAVDLGVDSCVVLGSEGEGIRESVLNACDLAFTIPISSSIDSLNVACASAAVLTEATRQRFAAS